MNAKEYTILRSAAATRLADLVTAKIRDGWQPIGGLCHPGNGGEYFQAMVLLETDSDAENATLGDIENVLSRIADYTESIAINTQ